VWRGSGRETTAPCSLTKKLCEHEITPDEVKELRSQGKSPLIENFIFKRGNKFAAHLVLSAKKDKAEFEFLPC
jgi:DNA topoisomerase-3